MRLYSFWRSSCSWRVRIVLALEDVDRGAPPAASDRDLCYAGTMSQARAIVSLLVALASCAVGCGEDHRPVGGTDGGRETDAEVTGMDGGGVDATRTDAGSVDGGMFESCDAMPSFECVGGTPGGSCGDALQMPSCVAGGWRCPDGTIDSSLCACIGRPGPGCVCAPGGWVCDGGVAMSFACGPALRCASASEYCMVVVGGPAGSEPSYSCLALPADCGSTPTCACLASSGGSECSSDSDGNLTVRLFAP